MDKSRSFDAKINCSNVSYNGAGDSGSSDFGFCVGKLSADSGSSYEGYDVCNVGSSKSATLAGVSTTTSVDCLKTTSADIGDINTVVVSSVKH